MSFVSAATVLQSVINVHVAYNDVANELLVRGSRSTTGIYSTPFSLSATESIWMEFVAVMVTCKTRSDQGSQTSAVNGTCCHLANTVHVPPSGGKESWITIQHPRKNPVCRQRRKNKRYVQSL